MTIFNNIIDNNYVIYGLLTTTIGFMGYLVIKSYLNSTVIETPNSPQTFNFTLLTPNQYTSQPTGSISSADFQPAPQSLFVKCSYLQL